MLNGNLNSAGRAALAAAGLSLIALTACSGGSATQAAPGGGGATAAAAGQASAADGQPAAKSGSPCTLVTARELSQAAGTRYTAIGGAGTGTLCNVTGASAADSFLYHVDKEDGSFTTWDSEVATIKEDDGSVTSVSGIGDRAVQGGVKEFAAESHGYIVVVIDADFNNPATASSFARTRKIEQLLVTRVQGAKSVR